MVKKLTAEQQQTLQDWLVDKHLNSNRMAREFSDATLTAALIKNIIPNRIDLHNYPVHNSTQKKLVNWETLNFKVLSKIGLKLQKADMEKLATATPGVIESVLFDIMQYEQHILEKEREKKMKEQQNMIYQDDDEIIVVNVCKKIGDALLQIPQKMLPYSKYLELEQDTQKKEIYCKAAMEKIEELKNMVKRREESIETLCTEMSGKSIESKQRKGEGDELKNLKLNIPVETDGWKSYEFDD